MQDCIFCKIVNKEIPAEIIYENEKLIAFKDLNPAAPVHLLIIPKKHIPTLLDISETDIDLFGEIQLVASNIAKEMGLQNGCRLIANCNKDAGQEVYHIHYHLLAGRKFNWPPG